MLSKFKTRVHFRLRSDRSSLLSFSELSYDCSWFGPLTIQLLGSFDCMVGWEDWKIVLTIDKIIKVPRRTSPTRSQVLIGLDVIRLSNLL